MKKRIQESETDALVDLGAAIAVDLERSLAEVYDALADYLLDSVRGRAVPIYASVQEGMSVLVSGEQRESAVNSVCAERWWCDPKVKENDFMAVVRLEHWRTHKRCRARCFRAVCTRLGCKADHIGVADLMERGGLVSATLVSPTVAPRRRDAQRNAELVESIRLLLKHAGAIDTTALLSIFDRSRERYAYKLAAAVLAWLSVDKPKGKSERQAIEDWLRARYVELGLVNSSGKPCTAAIEECAKVANWNTKGGAPTTPKRTARGRTS